MDTQFSPGDVVRVNEGTDVTDFLPDVVGYVGYVVAVEQFDVDQPTAIIVKLIGWEDVIFFAPNEVELIPKIFSHIEHQPEGV